MKPRPSWDEDVLQYIKSHPDDTDKQVAAAFGLNFYQIGNVRSRHKIERPQPKAPRSLKEAIEQDISEKHKDDAKDVLQRRYDFALKEIERYRKEQEAIFALQNPPNITRIEPHLSEGSSEAVFVAVASDWHIEETVTSQEVNGLNEYNLDIAHQRITRFFQNSVTMLRIFEKNVKIPQVVFPLLGDFISGNIHEELMENTSLLPSEAIVEAQNMIIAGIDFFLNHTKADFIIPAKSGNHARITKKQRISTEEGNSLEAFMYRNLAKYYEHEPRIKFIISTSYHIYLDIFGTNIRFHHGHQMKFGGGVGGIYIPVNKALAQWNKARKADLDIFGHFHQFRDGGNFICNGSAIGYNAFALSIKADFERPQQACFLVDKKRGKTITAPILLNQS
jgi:hypothetical protein